MKYANIQTLSNVIFLKWVMCKGHVWTKVCDRVAEGIVQEEPKLAKKYYQSGSNDGNNPLKPVFYKSCSKKLIIDQGVMQLYDVIILRNPTRNCIS